LVFDSSNKSKNSDEQGCRETRNFGNRSFAENTFQAARVYLDILCHHDWAARPGRCDLLARRILKCGSDFKRLRLTTL
jgi:hypothetical protein